MRLKISITINKKENIEATILEVRAKKAQVLMFFKYNRNSAITFPSNSDV